MRIDINFDDFKETPLRLSADVRYVAHGDQALVVRDQGAIVKLYYVVDPGRDGAHAYANAQKERDVLSWFSDLPLEGVQTPKPYELHRIDTPVDLFFQGSNRTPPHVRVVAALRMSEVQGEKFSHPQESDVANSSKCDEFYHSLGQVMAQFHQVTANRPAPCELRDATKCAGFMRRTLSEDFSSLTRQQREWLLEVHGQVQASHPADRLLQGDFHGGNVLVHPGEARISGVFDFGSAKMGVPETDMIMFSHFAEDGSGQRKQRAVLDGYVSVAHHSPDLAVTAVYNMINAAQTVMSVESNPQSSLPGHLETARAYYGDSIRTYHRLTGQAPPDGVPKKVPCPTW